MPSARPDPSPRIFSTAFAAVYPLYVQKAERKGRTQAEVDAIIEWLTGYRGAALRQALDRKVDFATFFAKAPRMNPQVGLITGVVCGVRVEEVADPLMRNIRYLDKLIDELAKGRAMTRILRGSEEPKRRPKVRRRCRQPAKVSAAKVSAAKVSAAKVSAAKVSAAKAPAAKVSAAKVSAAKVSAAKVSAAKAAAAPPIPADIAAYHRGLAPADRALCEVLATEIAAALPDATGKVWHRHPVWFLDGNPVVGYVRLKGWLRLLFWSGQSFEEPALVPEGSFRAAEARLTAMGDLDRVALRRWLGKCRTIQWDYQNLAKRKGRLERLR
jgi:hypothetical protein